MSKYLEDGRLKVVSGFVISYDPNHELFPQRCYCAICFIREFGIEAEIVMDEESTEYIYMISNTRASMRRSCCECGRWVN